MKDISAWRSWRRGMTSSTHLSIITTSHDANPPGLGHKTRDAFTRSPAGRLDSDSEPQTPESPMVL